MWLAGATFFVWPYDQVSYRQRQHLTIRRRDVVTAPDRIPRPGACGGHSEKVLEKDHLGYLLSTMRGTGTPGGIPTTKTFGHISLSRWAALKACMFGRSTNRYQQLKKLNVPAPAPYCPTLHSHNCVPTHTQVFSYSSLHGRANAAPRHKPFPRRKPFLL